MEDLFEDWLEKIPVQTLTNELKESIIEEHKASVEKLYTEEEVKLILYSFKNSFDKPCYTTQLEYDRREYKAYYKIDSIFPMNAFFKQHLKNYKDE